MESFEGRLSMEDSGWHLDRKVPIGIIVAIIGQTLFFTYVGSAWKSETDGRLATLEQYKAETTSQESRIVILEQQFGYIRESLAEIKDLIRSNGDAIKKKEAP